MITPTDAKCSRFSRTVWEEDSIFSTEMLSLEDAESIEQEYREEIAALRQQLADTVAREAVTRRALTACREWFESGNDSILVPDYFREVTDKVDEALAAQPSGALEAVREVARLVQMIASILCEKRYSDDSTIDAGSTAFKSMERHANDALAKLTAAFGVQPETDSAP